MEIEEIKSVEIGDVYESPTNPRKYFDKAKMKELEESIKEKGIVVPLIARHKPMDGEGSPRFELIVGARRFRAGKAVGLKELPVIFRDLSDEEVKEIQLIEKIS